MAGINESPIKVRLQLKNATVTKVQKITKQ